MPQDVVRATLFVGLELVQGKVWFDDIELRIGRPVQPGQRKTVLFKGHALPRLRGVMHGPESNEENIRVLAQEWGANQVRWQLHAGKKLRAEIEEDLEAYDRWLADILAACRA